MIPVGHDGSVHADDEHHPKAEMRTKVPPGNVTLFGHSGLPDRTEAAKGDPQKCPGAFGVLTLLANQSHVHPADVKAEIIRALQKFAETNAERIRVSVLDGGRVILEGRVQNWNEREIVYKAVSSLPGVQSVNDHLTLS